MKNGGPLVSVIIPTKNSSFYISSCLVSIQKQEYQNIEIIVVDNYSHDNTLSLAKDYTKYAYSHGSERSSQRNFGAKKARGEYVLFIDSDMLLSPNVITACVNAIPSNKASCAIAIPEESFGEGFWAQCKVLERRLNLKAYWLDAARFFNRGTFIKIGGYDETLISGEDWDLSQRIAGEDKVIRIKDFIYHNEGKLSLRKTVSKKFYYARQISKYTSKYKNKSASKKQGNILKRYALYFSQPALLFNNPFIGFGMLFMKSCEFAAGAVGVASSIITNTAR